MKVKTSVNIGPLALCTSASSPCIGKRLFGNQPALIKSLRATSYGLS